MTKYIIQAYEQVQYYFAHPDFDKVEKCEDAQADFFTVFEKQHTGQYLALNDFASRKEAQAYIRQLKKREVA